MTEPLSLWSFARASHPCYVAAYNVWFRVTASNLPLVSSERCYRALRKRYPVNKIPITPEMLTAEYELRAFDLRNQATLLLGSILPAKLRRELQSGSCRVVARRQDNDELVEIASTSLAGMELDISMNRLLSKTVIYDNVAVYVHRKGRGRREGDGQYNDMPVLLEMRAMIESRGAKSAHEAATKLQNKAQGASSEARVQRLQKAYKIWEKSGYPKPDELFTN